MGRAIHVDEGEDLAGAIEDLSAGDVLTFDGDFEGVGKVRNLHGTPGAPIVIQGATSDCSIGSSGVRDVGNLRIEDSSWVTLRNFTVRDATLDDARGIQLFRCNDCLLEDLFTGPEINADHVHLVGCEDCLVRRVRSDGTGGDPLRPGVAGHAVYVAEGCLRVVVEDLEATGLRGAPLQANGEDGPVRDTTFRRCRVLGWIEGAAVNLPAADGVTIEDLEARSDTDDCNGGVRAYSGARQVTLARYVIDLPAGVPEKEGPVQIVEEGEPAAPSFAPEPEPEPPNEGPETIDCPTCLGDGMLNEAPCVTCGGTGRILQGEA